jgi:hypothetical protein
MFGLWSIIGILDPLFRHSYQPVLKVRVGGRLRQLQQPFRMFRKRQMFHGDAPARNTTPSLQL